MTVLHCQNPKCPNSSNGVVFEPDKAFRCLLCNHPLKPVPVEATNSDTEYEQSPRGHDPKDDYPTRPGTRDTEPMDSWRPSTRPGNRTLTPGSTIAGTYRIVEVLGKGGMGTVFLVEDLQSGERRALKVPNPQFQESRAFLQRFENERRAFIKLSDQKRVPKILDVVDNPGGPPCLVMEYLPGESLAEKLGKNPTGLPIIDAIRYTLEAAEPLTAAHSRGIIHRDLKPQNLMIRDDGRVFVMDFGLVLLESSERISMSGELMGTPLYMSPEQVAARRDIRGTTDIYSLGAILYEMLTGRTPFSGSPADLFKMIPKDKPVPPSTYRPGIDPRLDEICLKALAKAPEDRYQSMDEMAMAIGRLSSEAGKHEPIPPTTGRAGGPGPKPGGERKREPTGWPKKVMAVVISLGFVALAVLGVSRLNRGSSGGEPELRPFDLPSGKTQLKMIPVPGSSFAMGRDSDRQDSPGVKIRSYYLAETEIPWSVVLDFWEDVPSARPAEIAEIPADRNRPACLPNLRNWTDLLNWLSKRSNRTPYYDENGQPPPPGDDRRFGDGLRLPTEAELELALRKSKDPEERLPDLLPVGEVALDAGGFRGLRGNLWELSGDWLAPLPSSDGLVEDPAGPPEGETKVIRGGRHNIMPRSARAIERQAAWPDKLAADQDIGARIATYQAPRRP